MTKQMLLLVAGLAMWGCGSSAAVDEPVVTSVESEVQNLEEPLFEVESDAVEVEQPAPVAEQSGIDCSQPEPATPRCMPGRSAGTDCDEMWERVHAYRAACQRPRG
jgi:hypothetical protein